MDINADINNLIIISDDNEVESRFLFYCDIADCEYETLTVTTDTPANTTNNIIENPAAYIVVPLVVALNEEDINTNT